MNEKITFTMALADHKKHSNRFDFESNDAPPVGETAVHPTFKPSFYVPKQHFAAARRIRVTIEELP